jgi:hypothetical protein
MQHVYPTDKFTARFIHGVDFSPFALGTCVSNCVYDDNGRVFHFEGKDAIIIQIDTAYKTGLSKWGFNAPYSDTQFTYQIVDNVSEEIYPKKDNNLLVELFGAALRDIDKLKSDVKALKRANKPKRTYKRRKK